MADCETCPKCGSKNVAGLVNSFWYSVSEWDGCSGNTRLASETDMGEARMCPDCEHQWDDSETVDSLRKDLDRLRKLMADAYTVKPLEWEERDNVLVATFDLFDYVVAETWCEVRRGERVLINAQTGSHQEGQQQCEAWHHARFTAPMTKVQVPR